jgi:hypothetical protein
MNIFLVTGPDSHAVQSVWQTLQHLGVQAAKPSRREGLLPQQIHDLMNQALPHRVGDTEGDPDPEPSHKILGKVWHELAADLFLGNIVHRQWGWPMLDTAQLLDYWLDFDPSTRLVLAYISPTEHLYQQLQTTAEIAPDVTEQALAQWCEQVEGLMARFHKASPRCVLVHANTVHGQPAQLTQAMRNQWNLPGLAPISSPVSFAYNGPSIYQQALLNQMVSASPAAELLWQELEATAHVPSGLPNISAPTIHHHWIQQAKLAESQAALGAATQARKTALTQENELLLLQLHHVQEELEKTFLEHQSLASQTAQAAEQHQAQLNLSQVASSTVEALQVEKTALTQENELLLLQLHHVQEELEKTFLEHQSLASQTAQAAEQHQAQLNLSQAALSTVEALQVEKTAQTQENELLLLQLHQVQEELEHYFLQYQDATQKHQTQLKPLQSAVDFWQRHPPEVIKINLCEHIDGQNWYYPEADGSWSGPGLVSTLQMPPMPAGSYMLELHVKDAMQPEIVLGQQVFVVSRNADSVEPVELVHEFAEQGDLYPMVSMGLLELTHQQLPWTLQISLPHNVSPADSGSNDTRRLGIKLQAIRLIRQNATSDATV